MAGKLKIYSPAFANGSVIPEKYTCDGENTSPELLISGVPETAKSLVLIMEDPDVPKNLREDCLWVHWVRFNIPIDHLEILAGEEPQGTAGINTNGNLRYRGPCPPDREHRYFFKLYALDTTLDLPEGSTKLEVEEKIKGHIVEETVLMGKYERS